MSRSARIWFIIQYNIPSLCIHKESWSLILLYDSETTSLIGIYSKCPSIEVSLQLLGTSMKKSPIDFSQGAWEGGGKKIKYQGKGDVSPSLLFEEVANWPGGKRTRCAMCQAFSMPSQGWLQNRRPGCIFPTDVARDFSPFRSYSFGRAIVLPGTGTPLQPFPTLLLGNSAAQKKYLGDLLLNNPHSPYILASIVTWKGCFYHCRTLMSHVTHFEDCHVVPRWLRGLFMHFFILVWFLFMLISKPSTFPRLQFNHGFCYQLHLGPFVCARWRCSLCAIIGCFQGSPSTRRLLHTCLCWIGGLRHRHFDLQNGKLLLGSLDKSMDSQPCALVPSVSFPFPYPYS